MTAIQPILDKIQRHYDPEFDMIPNGPRVTWAESDLADAIATLLHRVEELEEQVTRLQEGSELEESVRIYGTK